METIEGIARAEPGSAWLTQMLRAPQRLFDLYRDLLHASQGEPGVRCGSCGGAVKPDAHFCAECEAW